MKLLWTVLLLSTLAKASAETNTVVLNFPDSSTVNDSLIRISDIAQVSVENPELVNKVASSIAGCAAPPGFSRLINIDDMVMYRLKPLFPGITFFLQGSKRLSVRTDCKTVSIKEIQPEIQKYLDSSLSWKPGEWSFEIENRDLLWRGYDKPYTITVDGVNSGYMKGTNILNCNFNQGTKKTVLRVICHLNVITGICVAKNELPRGTVLSENDLKIETKNITSIAPGFFTRIEDLIGSKTVVTLNAGTSIQNRMICRIPDITNGDNIQIIYNKGRIRCSVSGTARESGNTGDKIWVSNSETKQLLRVKIISKGIVEIV
ncbi:MAG TPA: flagellar basal body P-ring formation chaperone FlgA [Chitinispirillaceae bacterium]|nr:flagellar basal body P-ring formation chaperone FlgA [Chitinispirillaceae bacterium]